MQGIGFGDLSVKALGFRGYGKFTVLAFRGFRTVECYRLGFQGLRFQGFGVSDHTSDSQEEKPFFKALFFSRSPP